MTKQECRALRDEIKAAGLHCTIPRGGKFPTIITDKGQIAFESRQEWLDYRHLMKKRESMLKLLLQNRSPMAKSIDEACGITWEAYRALEWKQ